MQKKKKKKMFTDGDKLYESTLAHPNCSYSVQLLAKTIQLWQREIWNKSLFPKKDCSGKIGKKYPNK